MTWNKAAERILGYSEEEAVGQPESLVLASDRNSEEGRSSSASNGVNASIILRRPESARTAGPSMFPSPSRPFGGRMA